MTFILSLKSLGTRLDSARCTGDASMQSNLESSCDHQRLLSPSHCSDRKVLPLVSFNKMPAQSPEPINVLHEGLPVGVGILVSLPNQLVLNTSLWGSTQILAYVIP